MTPLRVGFQETVCVAHPKVRRVARVTLGATAATCRSPRSGGSRRRRGRALRAWSRINRSIRLHRGSVVAQPSHPHLIGYCRVPGLVTHPSEWSVSTYWRADELPGKADFSQED